MTEVYIVRHCESEANVNRSFAGRTDVDISEKGKLQLDCLAEYFKNIKINKIYSSPLIRARKTADAINKYNSAPIIIDERLIEMNLGVLDGKPVDEMTPIQKDTWNNAPHLFSVEKGETMAEVAKRAKEAFFEIIKENQGKIVISSHGCFIRNLMRILMGLGEEELSLVPWNDNTGITHIIYDGNIKIDFVNYTNHLSEEAKSKPVSSWTKEDSK